MNRVLVIGESPSPRKKSKVKLTPTFKRLNTWMDQVGVKHYSFTNLVADTEFHPSKIDTDYIKSMSSHYNNVLALGINASWYLDKMGVHHHALPHPSPRNRKFNDKNFEKTVIKGLQTYLNVV